QAYRLAGDCALARASYDEYLARAPAAPNRDKVEVLIQQMGDCAAPVEAPRPLPAAAPPAAPEPAGDRRAPIVGLTAVPRQAPAAAAPPPRRGLEAALVAASLTLGIVSGYYLARGAVATERTDDLF